MKAACPSGFFSPRESFARTFAAALAATDHPPIEAGRRHPGATTAAAEMSGDRVAPLSAAVNFFALASALPAVAGDVASTLTA